MATMTTLCVKSTKHAPDVQMKTWHSATVSRRLECEHYYIIVTRTSYVCDGSDGNSGTTTLIVCFCVCVGGVGREKKI